MSENFVDQVTGFFSAERIEKLSVLLGDESQQIEKTLRAGIPIALNGLIDLAGTREGAHKVASAIQEAHHDNVLSGLDHVFSGAGDWTHKAGRFLKDIFGGNESNVVQKLSHYSGVKSSSSKNLLAIVASIILGILGKNPQNHSVGKGLAANLAGLLPFLASLLPSGLSFSDLGLKDASALRHGLDGMEDAAPAPQKKKTSVAAWLIPLLILAGLLLWWLLRNRGEKEDMAAQPAGADTTVVVAPDIEEAKLPDGLVLQIKKGRMEYKLLEFINNPNMQPGKDVWFDFDAVNFDLNSAEIDHASDAQLQNISDILKAYPAVKVKVGGYTDKTGNEEANLKLSHDRADAILQELLRLGVPQEQLIEAEGYGSEFATMPADATEEERRVDRRMALSVREK